MAPSGGAAAARARRAALAADERGEDRAATNLLPDDALVHVLRRIPSRELISSSAFVCRRWRRLCRTSTVAELVPSPFSPSDKPWGFVNKKTFLELAMTYSATLEKVDVTGFKRIGGKDIVQLCQGLPKLRDLSIISCFLAAADYQLIANHLPPQLVAFDTHFDHTLMHRGPMSLNCSVLSGFEGFDDAILEKICQRCPRLEKLDLEDARAITPSGLNVLLTSCQFLTSLDLSSDALSWREVVQVFANCESLSHFSLVSRSLTDLGDFAQFSGIFVSDDFMGEVVFDSEALRRFAMPKNLTSMRIYSSPHRAVDLVHPPLHFLLRSGGHQLQQLHAQGVFNTSWKAVEKFCPNLKLLDLSHCSQDPLDITEVEEKVLVKMIHNLKDLERIALPSATNRILIELGHSCPNLREIRFQVIGSKAKSTHFRDVSDAGVVAIAEGCPNLRVLSLAGFASITISSTRAIAFHCRHMKVLILHQCNKIKDDGVAALLPRLSQSLLYLDVVGCRISQATLFKLRQYVKNTSLRVVTIGLSLRHNSTAVINDIHLANPFLKIKKEGGVLPWDGFYHGNSFP